MVINITTLSENTVAAPFVLAEWGLSILVETDEANILLGTGASNVSATHNADCLGIDLGKVDRIVISHGHFDHTGGLQQVLFRMRKEVEIIAHPDMWAAKHARRRGDVKNYCGARFSLTKEPTRITDNIMTTGEVPMVAEFEEIEPNRFFVKEGSGWQPDKLLDDQAIIINTEMGLVVLLGCAHHGIINTLYHARQVTGVKQIHMVLGGCHLVGASEERVLSTVAALKELDVQKVGVSHCTGMPASVIMAQELGDRFFFNNAGMRISLP